MIRFAVIMSLCFSVLCHAYDVKPERFDDSHWFGATPFRQFDQSIVPVATADQFRAALEVVREEVAARSADLTKKAQLEGKKEQIVDHNPLQPNPIQDYRLVEILKIHHHDYSSFAVRGHLSAYDEKGKWLRSIGSFRYVVYVNSAGKIVAMEKNDFTNVIESYKTKLAAELAAGKNAKENLAQVVNAQEVETIDAAAK